ncbi:MULTISPECIES: phosphatase PAP2 family protein [Methanosarcina]|uniref:Phosphatidylglycerophosphatase B n=2 Tax=Methanosarcina barkeri TaxID=2208 RepID=A0A0E3QVA1_METBA|nr:MULTISPECIES: phosphatase PAP2 family protein [Methanosarcina]AKB54537.1 Phosphatidylglycerophosphatase B [Methanosarcina barkeri MS]AKB57384.1 Phosphatidylglycerophosphatase B [Methanosarcina barkeri 227]OEC90647.1 phosphatidic acid phosphatase [Methanosarcina sp. A14]
MFQTEPILYLQSLGNDWLTSLMILITSMGSSAFLVAIVVIVTFGVNFRKGFLLFQLLIWTGLITEIIKTIIAFPRPDYVDNRVLNLEYGVKSTSPFNGSGPDDVFELPDKKVLETFRLQEALSPSPFGFPSGHVAITTALWGGSSTIFNSRKIKMMAPFMVLLVALSRMYLGRHFLGDILGGAIIGLFFLTAFVLFLKSPLKDDFFKKDNFELALKSKNLILYFVLFVIPLVLITSSMISAEAAGFFLGTNAAYVLIIRRGLPDDAGSVEQRVLRIFIALLLFGISSFILDLGFDNIETVAYFSLKFIEFLKAFIPASTIWVSVVVCTKLNLYRTEKELLSNRKGALKQPGHGME